MSPSVFSVINTLSIIVRPNAHIYSLWAARTRDSAQKCWSNCGWLWSSTKLSQLQLIKYTAMRAVQHSLKAWLHKSFKDINLHMTWTKKWTKTRARNTVCAEWQGFSVILSAGYNFTAGSSLWVNKLALFGTIFFGGAKIATVIVTGNIVSNTGRNTVQDFCPSLQSWRVNTKTQSKVDKFHRKSNKISWQCIIFLRFDELFANSYEFVQSHAYIFVQSSYALLTGVFDSMFTFVLTISNSHFSSQNSYLKEENEWVQYKGQ